MGIGGGGAAGAMCSGNGGAGGNTSGLRQVDENSPAELVAVEIEGSPRGEPFKTGGRGLKPRQATPLLSWRKQPIRQGGQRPGRHLQHTGNRQAVPGCSFIGKARSPKPSWGSNTTQRKEVTHSWNQRPERGVGCLHCRRQGRFNLDSCTEHGRGGQTLWPHRALSAPVFCGAMAKLA